MILRPYQERYIEKVRQAYLDGFRAPCVVAPCGAGKSIIIGEIVRRTAQRDRKVLFLVHRRELCDQIEATFDYLQVPSDSYKIGMVQTVSRRLHETDEPSLIITDENHHGLASSYRKIYDYFADVRRLGFTATPIRLNGAGLGDVNDLLIEEVTASWLIDHKYLAPYRYFAPKLIDENQLKLNNIREFSQSSVDEAMRENRTIFGDVVSHYQSLSPGEKAICYCHSVEASIEVAQAFRAQGISAHHIDAKTSKDERENIIEAFRSGALEIITNVDLIGEGFDVPDCSTVILLRPTQSLSLYIQQSMRSMRYQPGKQATIIDHVGNVHRFGLPDADRTWSLENKAPKETTVHIKTCSYCYNVYAANIKRCPKCGYVAPIIERDRVLEVDKDAQLEEIKRAGFILDYREPGDCQNMSELFELAKNKNYKRGWAYHQGKLLGFI
jgi:superfamily II DNA or RNA helicase